MLRAQSKTATDHIFELQYADDAALLSHTADGRQLNLDVIAEAYKRAGLVINSKKTEVLIQESYLQHDTSTLLISWRPRHNNQCLTIHISRKCPHY